MPYVRDHGGLFVYVGDCRVETLATIFGTAWKYGDHDYGDATLEPAAAALGLDKLPAELHRLKNQSKWVWLADVPANERLFRADGGRRDPQWCCGAVHAVGAGHVVFLGDVNLEDYTVRLIDNIARLLRPAPAPIAKGVCGKKAKPKPSRRARSPEKSGGAGGGARRCDACGCDVPDGNWAQHVAGRKHVKAAGAPADKKHRTE